MTYGAAAFFTYFGRDNRDLIVKFTVLVDSNTTLAIAQSMPMELYAMSDGRDDETMARTTNLRAFRLASELTQLLTEDLLLVRVDALVSEEHNATLGD
jgi:hypothetical protein